MLGRTRKPAAAAAALEVQTTPLDPVAIAAQAERDLAEGRQRLAAAEADRETAASDYSVAVEAAAVADAQAARARMTNADVDIDIAKAAVSRLQAAHEVALDGAANAAALARREQRRTEAEEANEFYRETFLDEMPTLVASARKVLRAWAEADLARQDAAAEGLSIPDPDHFRSNPGKPREVVSTRVVDLWLNAHDGGAFADADQLRVKELSDGSGTLIGKTHVFRSTQKRRFEEVEFRAAVPERRAPNLAAELILPALLAGESAAWPGVTGRPNPRDVLAMLRELENAPPVEPVEPPIRTERRPIEPAREVVSRREPTAGRPAHSAV